MSILTDALLQSQNTLLADGQEIPASDMRAFTSLLIGAIGTLEGRARGNRIFYTSGKPGDALGLEGDLGVNKDNGDFFYFAGGTFNFLFNIFPKASAFVPIAQNAYGTHPAFSTQRELDLWLLQHGGGGVVVPPAPAAPTITSFSPTSGVPGGSVVLTGTNLSGATGYTFNGVAGLASDISANTATSITLVVPVGATTGKVQVTTPAGTAVSANDFTVTSTQGATPIAVYVLTGQSNAEGATPQTGAKTFSRTLIYNRTTDAIEPLKIDGFNGNNIGEAYPSTRLTTAFFGPEDGIATYYETNNPTGEICLLKAAYGGSAIEDWLPGGQRRQLLDDTITNGLARLVADGYAPTIRAIFWDQKESNSSDSVTAYQQKETTFFNSLSWATSSVKQVIMLPNVGGAPANAQNVRQAKINRISATTQARYVDPTGRYTYQPAPEDVHYDAASMRQAGVDYWVGLARSSNSVPAVTPPQPGGPTITSFTPTSAGKTSNNVVTVTGTNLSGVTAINVGATPVASFSNNTATSVTFTLAGNNTAGYITIACTAGTATSSTLLGVGDVPEATFAPFAPMGFALESSVTQSGQTYTTSDASGNFTNGGRALKYLPANTEGGVALTFDGTYDRAIFGFAQSNAFAASYQLYKGFFLDPAPGNGVREIVLVQDAGVQNTGKYVNPGGRYLLRRYLNTNSGQYEMGIYESVDNTLWNLLVPLGTVTSAAIYPQFKIVGATGTGLVSPVYQGGFV